MKSLRIPIALITLLFTGSGSISFSAPGMRVVRQATAEQATLTVTSTCGPASVRVKKGLVLTTPFTVTFARGKTIQLKALDASLSKCGALGIVSPFARFVVNQEAMSEGQRSISLTLDQDTAVQIQYGLAATTPVTLSVSSSCTRDTNILVSETTNDGQTGTLRTHFDAHFLPGQSVRLEAPPILGPCDDLGDAFFFANWSAGGRAYPLGQTAINLTLDRFTSAYAFYYTQVPPTLRVSTYQLRRNGETVDYIRIGENVSDFTLYLSGEPFPPEIIVFVKGQQAEIISRPSPTEIEIRLPALNADVPGYFLAAVFLTGPKVSNALPIEIRNQ